MGIGAGVGVAALEIARRYKVSPGNVGAIAGILGGIGTMVVPKGPLSNAAAAMAGVGIGLAIVERMQRPMAAQPQPQPGAPRQASGYVTREDLNEAVRRAMIQHQEDTIGAIRDELRNAAGSYGPQHYAPPAPTPTYPAPEVDEEPEPGSWLNAPAAPDAYDPEEPRNAGSWMHAAEPN